MCEQLLHIALRAESIIGAKRERSISRVVPDRKRMAHDCATQRRPDTPLTPVFSSRRTGDETEGGV